MPVVMAGLITVMLCCAALALRATQLLHSALWLAGASAALASLLYLSGAREVAVIELSIGAGLVTVLFVFAIAIAGDSAMRARPVVPPLLAWLLVGLLVLMLAAAALPLGIGANVQTPGGASFTQTLWQERSLDMLAQIALFFAGAVGVLGLLRETAIRNEARRKDGTDTRRNETPP